MVRNTRRLHIFFNHLKGRTMTEKGPIAKALDESIREAKPSKLDAAGVALARKYARALDYYNGDPDEAYDVLTDLGPKLHRLLRELGLTPVGRTEMKGGPGASTGNAVVDELRARRVARAANRDSTAPAAQ
jgi:hypothetical protein